MLQVSFTGQFKKDFKLCKKRGYNMELLQSVCLVNSHLIDLFYDALVL